MRTKKALIVASSIVGVLVVTATGLVVAVQGRNNLSLSLQSIVDQCRSSVDADGFGHAKTSAGHIQNEKFELMIPCILELKQGATLQLTKVTFETANLYITSETNAAQATHIVIKDSQLSSKNGGLYIQLPTTASSVELSNSTLKYPSSVGVSVGSGEDDTNAALRVTKSIFSSNSKKSEGILLVSTGQATFRDNQFTVGNADEDALLVAQQCQSSNNGSAIVHCQ